MKFSVIIPAYNSEDTIARLLDSLTRQSFKDFEVIVVDDCSRDNTAGIIQSYPYTCIRLAENRGPAFCRNFGADRARGEILVFIDSDCVADHRWIENIEKQFSPNHVAALMGRLVLMPSTFLGDSISLRDRNPNQMMNIMVGLNIWMRSKKLLTKWMKMNKIYHQIPKAQSHTKLNFAFPLSLRAFVVKY